MEITIHEALRSLNTKGTSYSVEGSTLLEWDISDVKTGEVQPTDAEITAEVTRLQTEYDSKQYARDRALAYPSLTDQADMAYWDRQDGTTTLDDAIAAVKEAYPKP